MQVDFFYCLSHLAKLLFFQWLKLSLLSLAVCVCVCVCECVCAHARA